MGPASSVVSPPVFCCLDLSFVVRSGPQHFPALATVHRHVNVLATDVDTLMIVRRNVDGEGPLEAVSELTGGPSLGIGRPHAHPAGQP